MKFNHFEGWGLMDHIDVKLLELLQADSRITVSELSKRLSLSRPSVSERLHRLEEKQVIEGYTARVSLPSIGRDILLFIQLSTLKIAVSEFEQLITEEQDILECHRVTGPVSYFIKAAVSDMNSMRKLIDRLITYGNVNTSIVLTSPVSYRSVLPTNFKSNGEEPYHK